MHTLFAFAFLASAQLIEQKPINYHDQLFALCDERAGEKCCRASVKAMRAEQARLYDETQGCPEGTQRVTLFCPASLNWCSRKTVREINEEYR